MFQSAQRPFTIADTESLSGEIDVLGWEVVGIVQPANTEGTSFTMQGSHDGENFFDIQTDSAEWSVTKSATAAQLIAIPPDKRLRGLSKVKVRSGTSSTPTVQATDAVCHLILAAPSGVS